MPLLRIQRYKVSSITVVDYFVTVGSYNAGSQSVAVQLDPSLFPTVGNYAILRTTGSISYLATPIGPTATWTTAHPNSYLLSIPKLGVSIIDSVSYNVIYVTVSA